MSPQVPMDAGASELINSTIEEPVGIAMALGSASDDLRRVRSDSEVPKPARWLLVCAAALMRLPYNSLQTCAGPRRNKQHRRESA
jgi:hypothetical protein